MFNEMKTKVSFAVKKVYRETDKPYWNKGSTFCEHIRLRVPGFPDDRQVVVGISRSTVLGDLYYKLWVGDLTGLPFLTVFGCWPQEWVVDVFCKTLAHYFDIEEKGE